MSDQDARQLLVDWANEQQHWVRSIVRDVLANGSLLAEAEIVEAFNACLAERCLNSSTTVEVPELIIDTGGSEGIERLQLTCLSEVERVNRLAPHQEIAFNDRLTILFGENATGARRFHRGFNPGGTQVASAAGSQLKRGPLPKKPTAGQPR